MHLVQTRSPISIVKKYKIFYIDCSKECEGMDWRGFKAYVSQLQAEFNAALIKATGEDTCHEFSCWPQGWTANFDVKPNNLETFNRVLKRLKPTLFMLRQKKKILIIMLQGILQNLLIH